MLLRLFLGASITISIVQYLVGSGQPNPDHGKYSLGSRASITAQGKYPLTMDLHVYGSASGAVILRRHLDALRLKRGR